MDVFGRSTKFGGGGGVYTRRGLRGDRGEKGIPGKLELCFIEIILPSYSYKDQVLLL